MDEKLLCLSVLNLRSSLVGRHTQHVHILLGNTELLRRRLLEVDRQSRRFAILCDLSLREAEIIPRTVAA